MTYSGALQVDYSGMMANPVNPTGLREDELSGFFPRLAAAHQRLILAREEGKLDFSRLLPEMQLQLPAIQAYVDQTYRRFDNLVILGIGGSALGPLAVHQALNHYYYNELPPARRDFRPRFYVLDNIDPDRFSQFLELIEPERTLFNVISKSGTTAETMAQFLIVREKIRSLCGGDYARHIVVTTDGEKGQLFELAREERYGRFVIPGGIGGRFSELTPVGLLPAALCGIDVSRLLEGALAMDQWIRTVAEAKANPAQMRAALAYGAGLSGKPISVFMPYVDGLKTMADWYAQLWAESLGKKVTRQGRTVHTGQTPVKALGVTDQHSQLQLYAEGPNDKVITFLTVERSAADLTIPGVSGLRPEIACLTGQTLSRLLQAEQQATEYALSLAGKSHQKIILPVLDAFSVGQLLLLLQWETAYMGELLDIDTFNQPGVEESKQASYALLGREGYEEKRQAIEAYGKHRYVVG